ncbi:MAG: DUF1611 domain-containing protein [Thermoflexibacter sp.]|jgi:uncharacterized NAD-dependent epimerase/dehydratase family protein|nr:DUF1611 domain-containing protein [Thermoflexibacter sp.]
MEKAIVLTNGLLSSTNAKTAHGLIRESERFEIVGIVDEAYAGRDAGEVLDGKIRHIPVFADVWQALVTKPSYCIVGVATVGGIFPDNMIDSIRIAIKNHLSIVNGLHDYLSERPDIQALADEHEVKLIDIRKPKKFKDLHFWQNKIGQVASPIVAVLGMDCAMGKRTTTRMLVSACQQAGINAQMIYTGQTGWLQGGKYGFILDSTLNDFVGGELEHAILTCYEETKAEIMFIEGQAALRNPSGTCGSEYLICGNAKFVVLMLSPKRKYFENDPTWGEIPSVESEIHLIACYGAKVIALALNTEACTIEEAYKYQQIYENQLGIPVLLPLQEGCGKIVPHLHKLMSVV